MISRNFNSLALLSAGAFAVLAAGCASVSPEEMDTQLADLRSQMESRHQELSGRVDNVESSVEQLERRMDALNSELEEMADEYETTVQRLESSLRFAAPVHFGFDATEVRSQDMDVLMRFASVVREHYPGALVTVEGFTDPAGSEEYNLWLGQQRADAVRTVLVEEASMSGEQVRAVSYGEDTRRLVNPGAAGADSADAMANRRVVLVVEHADHGGSAGMTSSETP